MWLICGYLGLQVRKIADESYEVALKHIRDNREEIDYIVDELVERETITGEVCYMSC